jgi:ribonuclease HIII/rRNA-processing protein FCF1/DNA-directed RNA polymerase subunit RPC12/RpoP
MVSNLVFQVKKKEQYENLKKDLNSQFTIEPIEFSEQFVLDKFKVISIEGETFVNYYKSGKLLIQGSPDSELFKKINEIAKKYFEPMVTLTKEAPVVDLSSVDKEYFVGLDESGAGESFDSMFLGISVITKENLIKAQEIIQPKDVKEFDVNGVLGLNIKSRKFFARDLKRYVAREIDDSNKIALLDKGYIELLLRQKKILPNSCVILDDYGIGPEFKRFIREWEQEGTRFILSHRADSTYLPVMAASIIARKARNTEIATIAFYNSLIDPDTKETIPFTSGSPSNPLTEKWLVAYRKINPYADFPAFVRSKWKNVRDIERRFPKKKISYVFGCKTCNKKFGKLLIRFNKIKVATELLCPDCGLLVDKDYFKSNFKTGTMVMDTSSLINRIVSKDLRSTKYFEGMKILIPSCVYEELDNKEPFKKRGAENEISTLEEFQNQEMIEFQDVSTDGLLDLSNDKKIIHIVKEHGASLITYDRTQDLWSSIGSFVFVITD